MGRFDSDAAALGHRASLNAGAAVHDLEGWIAEQVPVGPGTRVLDLGCGLGKQVFALAPRVVPGGSVLGIDISADAVAAVNRRAGSEALSHVSARELSLDDCLGALDGGAYDLVLSSYAIYYARDMMKLLGGLRSLLAPAGQAFICGPGAGTNRELIDLLRALLPAGEGPPDISDFIGDDDLAALASRYAEVRPVRLANRIRFRTLEDVLSWWRHHNLFRPSVQEELARALRRNLDQQHEFVLTKNVLGVLLRP
jgi:SAM-dependent methyltransferase